MGWEGTALQQDLCLQCEGGGLKGLHKKAGGYGGVRMSGWGDRGE